MLQGPTYAIQTATKLRQYAHVIIVIQEDLHSYLSLDLGPYAAQCYAFHSRT